MPDGDARLRRAFEGTPSVFELLRTVRNRRVAVGWPMDSGRTERHPVTARQMSQSDGPLARLPDAPAKPLSELEEALIAWAACGPNGIIAWDMIFGGGFNQLLELSGRTSPSPHNTGATDLFIVNDDGVFLYRPTGDPTEVVAMSGAREDRFDAVLEWYRTGCTRILAARPDFDWAMWQPHAPNAPLSGAAQYNLNRPGGTWFLPIADAGKLMFTLLDLMATGHKYLVDDFNGGRPAGLEAWIGEGKLETGVPISAQEQAILQAETYPAGALTQNVRLATEALGLGCWTMSGFNRDVLLGLDPDISAGLGFRWEPPNAKAPMATGRLKCFGLEGIKEATYVPSPRWGDGAALVDHWWGERYGPGGWADPSSAGLLHRGHGPWTDEAIQRILEHPQRHYPEWVWHAATSYIDYCVEHFGQWPVTFNPMQVHWGAVVHHVDTGFYDRHYRDGFVTDRIRGHDAEWDRP